ncbi:hypothetical protein G6O69_35060 [Pseudenhygromyxa sp. WMMC2535]|uniref:hypothetical protein n=1 Tax=Pseudenhygromyxa sp. WMMC2535 TaxID=2712867 RepID=UPI00155534D8|nr:hypothetical protein [Pseudenhygromyxa sp. WMMC2535]NVB43096.1 hypothetical protein [Pseudenhygromyxa sp. WMMC2535]
MDSLLANFVRPEGSDLWAFYLSAGLWAVILSFVWVMARWLRRSSNDEGHRGL